MSVQRDRLYAHLVGSVPLSNSGEVFRKVAGALGPYLRRLPDGETGERRFWVGYVSKMLSSHPDLEVDTSVPPIQLRLWNGKLHREVPQLKFKDGVDPKRSVFATRYGDLALESFGEFQRLQKEGVIPKGVRFQVALPTPLAIAYNYISPKHRPAFIESYTRQILEEVAKVVARVPAEQLSIQWDILQEILVWENYYGQRASDYQEEIVSVLKQITDAVPAAVDIGYHYCYGSPKDEHLIQPKDTGVMVEITNLVVPRLNRPLNFIHLPVPKNRSDDAYFEPLRNLKTGPETEIYLGLVHLDDSQGNRSRLATARKYVNLAKFTPKIHCELLNLGISRQIDLRNEGPRRRHPRGCCNRFQSLLVAANQTKRCALSCQTQSDSLADSAAGSGYNCNLIGEGCHGEVYTFLRECVRCVFDKLNPKLEQFAKGSFVKHLTALTKSPGVPISR
jgi:hypothetical protein